MPLETEIDGVCAIFDGSDQARPIAGRCEQLGLDTRPQSKLSRHSTERVRNSAGLGDRLVRLDHETAFNREVIACWNFR
jgi:hypothetical protein